MTYKMERSIAVPRRGVLDTTLCDSLSVTDDMSLVFYMGTPVPTNTST
jgi:hypothetical protein